MRISELFGLKKTQHELDFVDVDIDSDISWLETYTVRSGNTCRSLQNVHAAISGKDVPSERNLKMWSSLASIQMQNYTV